jgi:ubiquinone/menaquinone biosynthesis C-methylase UbiE
MRRLAGVPELLDGPLDDPAALRGNLRDLVRVNRWLGGTRLSARAVDVLLDGRLAPQQLLDVGTGAADIPVSLIARARRSGRVLKVTALDSRPEVMDAARAIDPRLDGWPGLDLVVADGATLPWDDRSFDAVHASLVLHHLEPPEAVEFLREARRIARRGVVVNDLVRARHHAVLARLLAGVATRNRYTRHDAPLSVRRAYTRLELRALLASAGLQPVYEAVGLLGHRVAIAAIPIPRAAPPEGTPEGTRE